MTEKTKKSYEEMTYTEKLDHDKVLAMKAKDKGKLATIRMLLKDLKDEQIKLKVDQLSEEQEIVVIDRYVKRTNEQILSYQKVGMEVKDQEAEKEFVLSYLPQKLNDAEILAAVEAAIIETGVTSKKEMGKIIKVLKEKYGSTINLGVVNSFLKTKLN